MEPWDVTVVGGGILGTSIAYWLADRFEGRIALLERERQVAEHTSRRNTGVVHRPFYLDPAERRVFARCSQVAYGMWRAYAADRGLPWRGIGTLEVATDDGGVSRLQTYARWGPENGMDPKELEVLTPAEVRRIEPHVRCAGALFAKTDTGVDFHALTASLRADAERKGATFLLGREVTGIERTDDLLELRLRRVTGPPSEVSLDPRGRVRVFPDVAEEVHATRFLINAAGGNAIDLAHRLGVGLEYTDLHFRGEYWSVLPAWTYLARRNVYSVPRHPDLPFLDPHWIVRANGHVEIGPNAVPVAGPFTYGGFFDDPAEPVRKFFEPPVGNKVALLANPDFLTLAAEESLSSLSRRVMARRMRSFLPDLRVRCLGDPGFAGIRASVIDRAGTFLKEAIEIPGPMSHHITNYNSPGATGAPAYTAWLVKRLADAGHLGHLRARPSGPAGPWDFEAVSSAVGA
jgi:L-2-hydroxyglutarate oxidase